MGNNSHENNNIGIIHYSVKYLFDKIKDDRFTVKASAYEIYNEEIIDLINLKNTSRLIRVRDTRPVTISGLTEINVFDFDDFNDVFVKGIQNRDRCNIKMNKQSSHSHLIFSLTFEEIISNQNKIFKLNFVVLAGSERSQSYPSSSDDVIDSVFKTDKGLVSLSKILTDIGDGNFCINYSYSKLTSILKDSFYNDSITLMLANVNQNESSKYETIRTLDFANFTKSISLIRNENNDNSSLELVNSLKNEIQILRKELDKHNHNESTNIETTFNLVKDMSYIESFMNHDENYNPNTERVEHNILINKIYRVDHSPDNKNLTKNNSTYVSLEPKILINRSTNDEKPRKSNYRKKSVEDKIGVINDKLKIFKDFQTSIKNKIAESELSKIKVIRNKNEEVTFYKREMHEKERKLKLLELEKEKNKELLGYHESTIYELKNELRNKSIELKNIKNIPVNKKDERKSAVRVSKNQNPVKNSRRLFLEAMKEMISEMERNISQKDKFEKRLEELVKEEEEANLNFRMNEEKIKNKIEALIKKKKYTSEDSESYNKSRIIHNSEDVSNLNLKLEKLNIKHAKIIEDLQGNKEIVLVKLSELNQIIDHLRNQISNGENVKIDKNVEEINYNLAKLERELKEKNEKCISLEIQCATLDNKFKEIEKTTSEKLLFYKVKSRKLEEEIKTIKEKYKINPIDFNRGMKTFKTPVRTCNNNSMPPQRKNPSETDLISERTKNDSSYIESSPDQRVIKLFRK